MRRGAFANANKQLLQLLLKSWCLVVEFHAKQEGMSLGEIERQLFSLDSCGRQWNRWKSGQLPPIDELSGATGAAVQLGWLDEEMSDIILNAYAERLSINLAGPVLSGWDLITVLNALEKYAGQSYEINEQLNLLGWYINGPEENAPDLEEWVSLHDAKHDLIDEVVLDESVEIGLGQLCAELYKYGVADPCKRIQLVLKKFQKEGWLIIKEDLDKRSKS